ncbi:31742_t:CDS:1, partial [Gigaspora margarita]
VDSSDSGKFLGCFGKSKSGFVIVLGYVLVFVILVYVVVGSILVVLVVCILELSSGLLLLLFGSGIGIGLFFIFKNAFENINNKAE